MKLRHTRAADVHQFAYCQILNAESLQAGHVASREYDAFGIMNSYALVPSYFRLEYCLNMTQHTIKGKI